MDNDALQQASTTEGLPISPSLGPSLELAKVPTHITLVDRRLVIVCVLAVIVGLAAEYLAQGLVRLIWFFTNLGFYGRLSFAHADALHNQLGPWVILVPVAGALVVGLMARYGSRAVAGHGIPEAMEQVLLNQSRIPARMTFLKPLAAAVSIGTGGPFGAEGPIIASGGAVGSLLGQVLSTTASERKILLAAGAAAGISATFDSPITAVLLAIELLLFEFRPRSIIPVCLAAAAAAAIHVHFEGPGPFFSFTGTPVYAAGATALAVYLVLGTIVGVGAVLLTQAVYVVEHFFDHMPIHWMWRPAVGAVVVGIIGWISPRTMGAGYFNIDALLSNDPHAGALALAAVGSLLALKFLSWTISLGSGTSGGTLAPVFTIGGALAAVLAAGTHWLFPGFPIDPRVAALMGMVAIFAGASRALLTSIVFAYEATHESAALLPAMIGCAAAYLVSALLMRHSIMTEKMARAGVRVPAEYAADFLDTILVRDVATSKVISLGAEKSLAEVRAWLHAGGADAEHQGYPVVNGEEALVGVVTRRDLFNPRQPGDAKVSDVIARPPVVVYADCSLRDAADHMANHGIGRLPVIERGRGSNMVGILTRSDLLSAHRTRLRDASAAAPVIRWRQRRKGATEAGV